MNFDLKREDILAKYITTSFGDTSFYDHIKYNIGPNTISQSSNPLRNVNEKD